ncbi:transposase [Falsiroseomonas algicola]|uniref:transposase n=1 Tax=Falsiroseomonas algicola TaxID=2716930 RepID=UPI001A992341|nr:transposase [Falsiroseomonas algicola]
MGSRQRLRRSRGGFTSKLHIRCNAHGLPIALHVTAEEADCANYDALMDVRGSDPAIMVADKGYDSDPIRQDLRDRGAVPEIPTKRTATSSTVSAVPSTHSAAASNASSTA